jgi:hypothetical protein
MAGSAPGPAQQARAQLRAKVREITEAVTFAMGEAPDGQLNLAVTSLADAVNLLVELSEKQEAE